MNQQRYRHAVRSIRWSPEQRAEIESKLRQDVRQPAAYEPYEGEPQTHEEIMREMYNTGKRVEEYEMKTRKFMKSYITIGLAALILTAGSTAALIAAYAKKHPNTIKIIWENGIMLNLTTQESEDPFSLNYSNNTNNFSEIVLPTETGWFFRKNSTTNTNLDELEYVGMDNTAISTLYYADKETGQVVPVCANPSCLHDGNIYCTATTKAYAYAPLTYYDGYLYAMTTKYLHPEDRSDDMLNYVDGDGLIKAEDCRQVLIRISPDGTEITELADFGTGKGTSKCIIHRGYVWCIAQLQNVGEEIENPITHKLSVFKSGGWQLWGYELATGKSGVMFDGMGDPTINHINEAPTSLFGAGDYIYFYRTLDDWSGGQGLCRLNLLDGSVTNNEEEIVISGTHLTAMSKTHAIRSASRMENGVEVFDYFLKDLETGEEIKLFDTFKAGAGDEERIQNEDSFSILAMDDDYIYAETYTNYYSNNYHREQIFRLYDYDGKVVKEIPTGLYITHESERYKDEESGQYKERNFVEYYNLVTVDHGIMYLSHSISGTKDMLEKHGTVRNKEMLYCAVDDLINGNAEWKVAYSMMEEVRGNAQ